MVQKIWASHLVVISGLELKLKNKLVTTLQNNNLTKHKTPAETLSTLVQPSPWTTNSRRTCFLASTTGLTSKVQPSCQLKIPSSKFNKSNRFSNRKTTSLLPTVVTTSKRISTWSKQSKRLQSARIWTSN